MNHKPEMTMFYVVKAGTLHCDNTDGCVFCKHCADLFWDYSNLIYMIICEKGHNPWNRPCGFFEEGKSE